MPRKKSEIIPEETIKEEVKPVEKKAPAKKAAADYVTNNTCGQI